MLDEPRTFEMAEKAVEEFGELREAHTHVVDLGHQKEALLLVQSAVQEYESAQESVADLDVLSSAVIPFADALKLESARNALSTASGAVVKAQNDLLKAQERVATAEEQLSVADRRVLKLGGGDQRNLQARITDAKKGLEQVRARRESLFVRMQSRGIPLPETEADYVQLLATAEATLASPEPQQISHEQQGLLAQSRRRVDRLERELESLNRRKSSIPSALLDVRDTLALELGIPEGLTPFAGELMSVRAEHKAWSGAIERALAPISTALLVRDRDLDVVRDAVNRKHLGLNLTIDAVPQTVPAPAPIKDERSLVYRVDVSEGPFSEYLNHQLNSRFDFACVDSPNQLDDVERGLTIQGLIKRSKRRYVKADRDRVDDRSRWVLGGDVEPKRRVLEDQLEQARAVYRDRFAEVDSAAKKRDKEMAQRHMLSELLQKPWSDIDVVAAAGRVSALQQQWADLVKPESELGQATEAQAQASARVRELRAQSDQVQKDLTLAQKEQSDLESIIAGLQDKDHPPIPQPVHDALDERFRKHRRAIRYDQVHEIATSVQEQLRAQLGAAQKQVQQASARFSESAAAFGNKWATVATNADLTAQIDDRRGYLDLLDDIVTRGLPEHEQNFRRLLNERSRESVAFLRDELMTAPRKIAQRIEPVNASLATSPFDKGVFLDISTKTRRSEEVNAFLGELKEIVDDSWNEEEFEQAEKRFQKLASIMKKLASTDRTDRDWRSRVLDSREHVTFIAKELDLQGEVVTVHDSSAGLSGGQRQKLVVFCLAAALRYQLGDPDTEVPQYATVILDEAFDKADAAYTRVAMDVFNAFGFHMVLATPQKLLQTLEPYLGGLTVVTNPNRKASHLSSIEY